MPFLQSHHIVDLYCWVDSLLPQPEEKRFGRPLLLSDSEVITALLWSVIALKQKTLKDAYDTLCLYHRRDFPELPTYKTFVRRAHHTAPLLFELLSTLLSDTERIRIMDSTMLPVCKLHRADAHKTAQTIAAFGKNWQGAGGSTEPGQAYQTVIGSKNRSRPDLSSASVWPNVALACATVAIVLPPSNMGKVRLVPIEY